MDNQIKIKRDLSIFNTSTMLEEEKREILIPENSSAFLFDERSFEDVAVIACDYSLVKSQDLFIDVRNDALKMHFRFSGNSTCFSDNLGSYELRSGEHRLIFHNNYETKVVMEATQQKGRFIEIMLSKRLFERFFADGNDFQKHFLEQTNRSKHVWTDRSLQISPNMYAVLLDLQKDIYFGNMKILYLEAKIIELMLLQVDAFDKIDRVIKLSQNEIEKIDYVKTLIEQNIRNPLTIQQMSLSVGLNMKKLTTGFKSIYHTTIFEYVKSCRMIEARRLLLDHKWFVSEVSAYLGYKNPQHFTVAFKKYYGVLPSRFKA